MDLLDLISLVGMPYKEFDENGYYLGCFEPIYLLHPECKKFFLPKNSSKYFYFAYKNIKENCLAISKNQIKSGDIIVFKFPGNILHVGVYLGNNKFIHTFKNSSLTINKIDFENKRIIGIYRLSVKKEMEY